MAALHHILWGLWIVILVEVALAAAEDEKLRKDYSKYVAKYSTKKVYDTFEFEKRFQIYSENAVIVHQFNENRIAKRRSVRLGLSGPFADWTRDEFEDKMLMPKSGVVGGEVTACTPGDGEYIPSTPPPSIPLGALSSLPSSFDWRTLGAVGPVQDQGSVGTCWAFSTVENIAGQWFLAGHTPFVTLSAEQMNDCDNLDCGVFGGWPCRAYQYVIHQGGVMSDASYPYCVGTGACFPCVAQGYNESFCGPGPEYCNSTESCRLPPPSRSDKSAISYSASIQGWTWYMNENETAIAYRLKTRGPLSVLIDANMLQFYETGVWDNPWCDPTSLDHAVLLVGWDTEDDIVESYPYWWVKNSWSTDWGLQGYFKLLREPSSTVGMCGVATSVTTSLV